MRKKLKELLGIIFLGFAFLSVFNIPSYVNASNTLFFKDDRKADCKFCNDLIYAAPNGTVYQATTLGSNSDKINAINSTGKRLWSYSPPKNSKIFGNWLTSDNKGNLYFTYLKNGSQAYLASVNSKGKLNWDFKINGYQTAPSKPIIGKDGTVYFGTGNYSEMTVNPTNTAFALNSKGKVKWSKKLTGDAYYSKLFFDSKQNIIIPTSYWADKSWKNTISPSGSVKKAKRDSPHLYYDKSENEYSFNYNKNILTATNKTGKKLWTYKAKSYASIEHVSENGTVFFSENGHLLSISKGKVNWRTKHHGMALFTSSNIYWVDYGNPEKIYIKVLNEKTGKVKYSKATKYYSSIITIHPKGFVLISKGHHIYKVSLFPEQTDPLKTSNIKIANYKGKKDTIKVSRLAKGDSIKVYNSKSKGKMIASKKATSSSVTLSVKQLGKKSGKVYITVTKKGMKESKRLAVSYSGEQSDTLKKSNIKIKNNKGKKDTIKVSRLSKGDKIKVYNTKSKGKRIASRKATSSNVTLSVKQLGKKSGKVYITVTKKGMKESKRLAVSYKAE